MPIRKPALHFLATLASTAIAAEPHPHWAFQPVADPPPPLIRDTSWPSNSIDHFILSKIETAELTPAPPADKHTLVRRAYFDLIGLPPTPAQVDAFVADTSPDAFATLVDQLLDSPHYGERWGRHWLDVARYGDSNGGDENHAYPHAFRYRNWVIDAFNHDLPYDDFVRQQLAGDLIDPSSPDLLRPTGFLAIGTKILAEKDPVKKRADIVDEQIDTLGRAFMAMTLGCARCHDHKFDPVPETDYYALAGIFHSTNIEDRPLITPEATAAQQQRQSAIAKLDQQITDIQQSLDALIASDASREWQAEKFARGNIVVDSENYGKGIGIIGDPGAQKNWVEYDIAVDQPGTYLVSLRYAAAESRPGRILLDGRVANGNAIAKTTGGWHPQHQQWSIEAHAELGTGTHILRLESEPLMSHIDKIKITPAPSASNAPASVEQLNQFQNQRGALVAASDQKHLPKTMAVRDGDPTDARLNLRGNPHDLGPQVPRGFLSVIAPAKPAHKITSGSGRRQLADWITDPAHPLTSRVIVNRIWHWHFGRGIVTTPDNFGTTGTAPSHPQLLDHLASWFVDHGWSFKALHRHIMLSSTYRTSAGDSENQLATELFARRQVRRLEAEAFRDAVLHISGNLDTAPPDGPPVQVKAQDPSPADLDNNRKIYEASPHRTVYLPVVRCHVYDLLTLLDFPNATTPVGDRTDTTVPTQALLMLNNPFLVASAGDLAASAAGLDQLYTKIFSRPISTAQRRLATDFLARYPDAAGARTALCQTWLISNDFLYVW